MFLSAFRLPAPNRVAFEPTGLERRHSPCPVPQKRRRRQAPARGPAAVYSLYRSNRTETQRARPLLTGRARVYTEPKALEAGTAGPAYMTWRIMHFRYFVSGAAGRMG